MSKAEASKAALEKLRASGYKGAVDQDGKKVEDVDAWIRKMKGR